MRYSLLLPALLAPICIPAFSEALPPKTHFDHWPPQMTKASDALSDSVSEAAPLCMAVEARSLDACGNVGGRGPAFSAARRAMITVYENRTRFISVCHAERQVMSCMELADLQVQAGLYDALK